jgi:hypothetical protein
MSRLDDYQVALLAAHPDVPAEDLLGELEKHGKALVRLIIDHGLGPLWHQRTGCNQFYAARMQAEALFGAQEQALREIDAALATAEIPHVVLKGAANRLLLYDNAAVRACHDLDILVSYGDRIAAAKALIELGFTSTLERGGASGELVLSRADADVDLHWSLVREGRLRRETTSELLSRRRRVLDTWVLSPEDTLFALLVHPAFRKHLASWNTGLHRIVDLLEWIRTQDYDWERVRFMLSVNGVQVAAWATLRWVQMVSGPYASDTLQDMLGKLQPGQARRRWLEYWLANDLSERTSRARWVRLLGFSVYLHDTLADARRAALAGFFAKRSAATDLEAFRELTR